MSVTISKLSVEAYHPSSPNTILGISHGSPRLSWRFEGDAQDWVQESYTVTISGSKRSTESYDVKSSESVLVPWPAKPLSPRESVKITVQVIGSDGQKISSPELLVERALESGNEHWQAKVVSSNYDIKSGGPFRVRKQFSLDASTDRSSARLYATALGLYEIEINGKKVGDQLFTPGWQSYKHRHHYQVFDVSSLLRDGQNEIISWVAEGWFGELGWMRANCYGLRIGFLCQLEIEEKVVLATDETWEWSPGCITSSHLYDGESWDLSNDFTHWQPVETLLNQPLGELIAPEAPAVRETQVISPISIATSPKGKTIIDFGQNLAGWIRIKALPDFEGKITLTHAEVLEDGELGVRPLRTAKNIDTIILGKSSAGQAWRPKFTSHGFRYIVVDGWKNVTKEDLEAVVIHTDMERTGNFTSSHQLINQFHNNVVWSMRGNFLSIPTDCPQRDERMGWTGDIQVFAPVASYLFDCNGMLQGWLQDLSVEQLRDNAGIPHMVVPDCLTKAGWAPSPQAIWCDVAVLLPWDLYQSYGDKEILARQWESMSAWLDKGVERDPDTGLWHPDALQLGDWLDPIAPPDLAGKARTNPTLVANIYLLHSTRMISKIAQVLGKSDDSERYTKQFDDLYAAFNAEFITPNGRLMSDSMTAYSLILKFNLIDDARRPVMSRRLKKVAAEELFKVATGFAGTPVVLDALAESDSLQYAYRMLQEKGNPSWLYPVSMGGTTTWERWDSMLEDGRINPGEMTSFNHYALGSASTFLHKYIGGISPLSPGWRKILVAPRPGGSLTQASASHLSRFGKIACSWQITDSKLLEVEVQVPPNCSATVDLPGQQKKEVGSGTWKYSVPWTTDPFWPPKAIWPKLSNPVPEGPCL